MKTEETPQNRICPICGKLYTQTPALSRADNKTPICPDCGTREALEIIGVNVNEQEKIIKIIHNTTHTD